MPSEGFFNQERLHFLEAHFLETRGAVRHARKAEIVRLDLRPLRHEYRPFDDMIQFAHVAGKFMTHEGFVRRGFEAGKLFPVTLCVLPQKVGGEWRDVFTPLAQRRQCNLDRVQTKKQILAETSGAQLPRADWNWSRK